MVLLMAGSSDLTRWEGASFTRTLATENQIDAENQALVRELKTTKTMDSKRVS